MREAVKNLAAFFGMSALALASFVALILALHFLLGWS